LFSPQTDEVHPNKDFKIIANIRKELDKMEEAAKWAEEQQRLRQEEYERAAKVRFVIITGIAVLFIWFAV
jgi:CHASE3 domain sensor protein